MFSFFNISPQALLPSLQILIESVSPSQQFFHYQVLWSHTYPDVVYSLSLDCFASFATLAVLVTELISAFRMVIHAKAP